MEVKYKRSESALKEIEEQFNEPVDKFNDPVDIQNPIEGLDADEVLEYVLKNAEDYSSFLTFFNWYERKFNREIIMSNGIVHDIFRGAPVRNKELREDVRLKMLLHFNSKKYPEFSIIHEYYRDLLPNIEKFSLEDLQGYPFAKYLIYQFPQLNSIYLGKIIHIYDLSLKDGTWYRFQGQYGRLPLQYRFNLPVYHPYEKICANRIEDSWHNYIPVSPREIEDQVRVEKGLPKIGEGWISETLLYHRVKEEFKELDIIQHGNPDWLKPQHLDIYIPELNIGIEYQGAQHQKPVDYFGGKKAFKKNKKRDEKKMILCEENGCNLFYVFPETEVELFLSQLKEFIANSSLDRRTK